MSTPTVIHSANLHYQGGVSDKVYLVQIVRHSNPNGYAVTFQYGRRDSTLQSGTKTPILVSLYQAERIFSQLVNEKLGKGYQQVSGPISGCSVSAPVTSVLTAGSTAAAATNVALTVADARQTDVHPQLLNPVDESELAGLIADDAWCAQPKHDGVRLLIRTTCRPVGNRRTETTVVGINRLGKTRAVPAAIEAEFKELGDTLLVDGEAVGERFHVFDVLEWRGEDYRPQPYGNRLDALKMIFGSSAPPDEEHAVGLVETACIASWKTALVERLRAANAEGVVFKNQNAPYVAGRPSSAGSQRKFKFYETISCIVAATNAKRSVSLNLRDPQSGVAVAVGNVTIPPNHEIPAPRDVVEVRYLYAFKQGSLFQPTYLGPRTDIPAEDCTTDQLKIKSEP